MSLAHDQNRGTGRTTRQLKELPIDGYFVVHTRKAIGHAKNLACHLGRSDIKVVGPEFLLQNRWHGLSLTGIDVDHWCFEAIRNPEFWELLSLARLRVREPSRKEGS